MKFRSLIGLLLLAGVIGLLYPQIRKSNFHSQNEDKKIREQKIRSERTLRNIECPVCHGSGRVANPSTGRKKICYICKGIGNRNLPPVRDGEEICSKCKGMGKIVIMDKYTKQHLGYNKCSDCRGRGLVSN
ncbi:MAG: hypothetical protein KAI43_01010 [Candidatus Aureabacteria bacterium]|nr:hypothetical protein [Candidatus Auribacterota bacterium]